MADNSATIAGNGDDGAAEPASAHGTGAEATPRPWHALPADEVLEALGSGTEGLGADEAEARRARVGPNRLEAQRPAPAWRLLVGELRNPLVLVLLAAAALLLAVGTTGGDGDQVRDALLIVAIVVVNGVIGFLQNLRARRGIEALRRLATPRALVVREGAQAEVDAEDVVPGDVVVLGEGAQVPADARLLETHELRVDESALTGESVPVTKQAEPVAEDALLADRPSMAYLATAVVSGAGRAVVTETGPATEVGKIAEAVREVGGGPTHFERQLNTLSRRLAVLIGVLVVAIAILQLTVGGRSLVDTFAAAVALAVAAIPEGLPVVLTLALAFGTRRMLQRNTLVRSIPVVEILGSSQVVCADKTGTVTAGRMSLRELHEDGRALEITGEASEPDGEVLHEGRPSDERGNLALLAAGLCNDAREDPEKGFVGDPTDVALLVGARKADVDLGAYRRIDEIPFSSERKRMSVIVEDGRPLVLAKGAPELIIERCAERRTAGGTEALGDEQRASLLSQSDALAGGGFRVIALAYKERRPSSKEDMEEGLCFLGLAALADPPRAEAAQAVEAADAAGIRVVMITGDNPRTAEAVGGEVGLRGGVLTGHDLDRLGDAELTRAVEETSMFARVDPTHKLRILEALQRDGERVVAMTGDGVNDAPAIKGADVGVAMGRRGTDVARQASDMVLLDDNLATIVAAVEEGRRVFANIRKFLNYLLTGNLAEVLVILVASLFGYLPITAVQILWVNLVTDSGPAVALGVDPAGPGLMSRPPYRGPVISPGMVALVMSIGTLKAAVILANFAVALAVFDLQTAQTVTFTALVVHEYLRLAVIRRFEGASMLSNRWLVVAVAVSLALHLLLLYSPLGSLFDAVPLGALGWGIVLGGLAVAYPLAVVVTGMVGRRFPDALGA